MEVQYPDHLIGALHILIVYCGLDNLFKTPRDTARVKYLQHLLLTVYGVDVITTDGIEKIMASDNYKSLDNLFQSKLTERKEQ